MSDLACEGHRPKPGDRVDDVRRSRDPPGASGGRDTSGDVHHVQCKVEPDVESFESGIVCDSGLDSIHQTTQQTEEAAAAVQQEVNTEQEVKEETDVSEEVVRDRQMLMTMEQLFSQVVERTIQAMRQYSQTGDAAYMMRAQRHLVASQDEEGDK